MTITSLRTRHAMSEAERAVRTDLAAAYRLVEHFGMHDMIYTHLSARVPGENGHFLINPFGLWFSEVTASNLVKIDCDGNIVEASEHGVNRFGFAIHSAFHLAHGDFHCVMHTHSRASMAVSAMECGLLPMNQMSLQFHGNLAYHAYEGNEFEPGEKDRLIANMGDHRAMILRNHGLLTAGKTVAEAFFRLYYLEQACQIQVDAMGANTKLMLPPEEVCISMGRQYRGSQEAEAAFLWKALLRKLDKIDPSFRD